MLSRHCRSALLAVALTSLLAIADAPARAQGKVDVLRIGTTGNLTGEPAGSPREKSGRDLLKSFITDETGLKNEIVRQKGWQALAEQMANKKLHLGVFQGYEFAWAQAKHADLKPLAIAVNVYRYPVAYVVTARTNPAKDFAGLKGQSLAIPATGEAFLRLFVNRQAEANGAKKADDFFSKITTPDNVEDALDDAVDGTVQAVVVSRASLEAYKQRKPGRFAKLKEVAQSKPFPPAVVAYYDSVLDEATLRRFKDGLLGAVKKEKGQTLLTMFHLSGFEAVPNDFERVLADSRKAYPAPKAR